MFFIKWFSFVFKINECYTAAIPATVSAKLCHYLLVCKYLAVFYSSAMSAIVCNALLDMSNISFVCLSR